MKPMFSVPLRAARKSWLLSLALLLAGVLIAPATASAVGTLTQKAGTAGCITDDGAGGCQDGTRIGGIALAISPDGKNVYATGFDGTQAVAVLDRDPLTGELTQKPGLDGCWATGGAGGLCRTATAMLKPDGVAVSHDGKNVYVSDFDQNSVMVFDRAADGTLTQKTGSDGCFSSSGHGGSCQVANGLSRESRLVVSPDDKNVYVASSGGGGAGAVAIFDRDLLSGELSQKAGADGCISSDSFAPCEAAIGFGHPEGIAASPDGKSIYVTARASDSVAVFDRAADGTLEQKDEPDGCWDNGGNAACSTGIGLDNGGAVKSPAVSPDGKNLYVPASGTGAIAIFDRDTASGAIEQKAGLAGCVSWDGTGGGCGFGFGVRDAAEVVVSPDGENVYLAGANNTAGTESGVAIFDRDAVDGTLTQKLGTEGCISPNGSGGACALGRALPAITLAISPDGKSVYAGGVAIFDRDAPTGGEEEEEGGGGPGGGSGGGGCPGDADCDGLADAADICPNTPRPGTLDGCPLRLDEVAPRSGGAGPITVRLRGRGFKPSPSVRLVRDGEPDVAATAVTRSGAQTLSASFDLDGAEPGKWEVVVAQSEPDAAAKLPFTVLRGTPPVLRARLLGQGRTISGYPWSGMLQVTNEGTTDARNALVRIDGFQARADATVIGPGATATHLDSGNSHSLLVSIDRVPQQTTKMLLVRFSAVGPGHSFYFLKPTVLATSVPGARPIDPSVQLTTQVQSASASAEAGTIDVSGTRAASYKVQLSDKGLGDPPEVKVTRSGGKIHLELSATMPAKPKAPPGHGGASASSAASASDGGGLSRVKLSADMERKAAGQVEVFKDLNGSYQLSISRKGVLDCLLTRRELSQAEHDNMLALADGVFTAQLIKTGAEISPRGNAAITFALSYGPDFMSWQFEARLARALRDEGAGDPNSRYFGLNPEEIVKLAYRNCLPDPPPPGVETFSLEVLTPEDPNDKVGLAGFRNRRWVARGAQMPYLVMFENVPTASAPAHEVRIEDRLDATKLDLGTLELGPVYFGDEVAAPPPGAQSWEGSIDLRPAKPLIVSIRAGLDRSSGVLSWHFRGLDPATGELQVLPELGFLPPNKTSPEGQGGVTFSVEQVPGLRHGAKISNGATIFFDKQGAIDTPVFTNRIDTRAPTSSVGPPRLLRASKKRSCGARLSWRGKDSGAGVALQDVYLSRNGHAPRLWRGQTKRRSSVFRASRPGAYTFFSAATDGAGNAMPSRGDLWSRLVRGTTVRRGGLVLRLSPKAARKLKISSLKVRANKRTVIAGKRVPARINLAGADGRTYKVTLVAKAGNGKGKRTLRASRAVVICSRR